MALDPRVADEFDLGEVFDVLTAGLISVIPSGYFLVRRAGGLCAA